MKVPFHIVQARREKLAALLEQHRYLPIQELCRRLEVSEATARRDLAALVNEKKATRTYGGALTEFNDRFPSFRQRQSLSSQAKNLIANTAHSLIKPGQTIFLDTGTTVFAIAEVLRDKPIVPLTVVTSNLPVGEILAGIPGIIVCQIAGQLFLRQSALLGDAALKSLEFWNFDLSFLSAEGMTTQGIWNTEQPIIEQQKRVIERSNQSVFCIDGSKLGKTAPYHLLDWSRLDLLVTEVPKTKLQARGIALAEKSYLRAKESKTSK